MRKLLDAVLVVWSAGLAACSTGEAVIGYGAGASQSAAGGSAGVTSVSGAGAAGLGGSGPVWLTGWSPPTPIAAIAADGVSNGNPSVTADRLELYFDSTRTPTATTSAVWQAMRASPNDPWGAPTPVAALADINDPTSAVSPDGLSLYVRVNGEIAVSQRATRTAAWGAPAQVAELSSTDFEGSARVDDTGTHIAFGRDSEATNFDLYASQRAHPTDVWATPVAISELNSPGYQSEPQLLDQALSVVYGGMIDGKSGLALLWSERSSETKPFAPGQLISALSSDADDTDVYFTPDHGYVVFASRRSGTQQIYESIRTP